MKKISTFFDFITFGIIFGIILCSIRQPELELLKVIFITVPLSILAYFVFLLLQVIIESYDYKDDDNLDKK